jgi:stage V sporulation protein B
MSERNKGNSFLVQGSILAATSLIVRIIGLLYRIPLINIIGNEGMGVYSNTFDIYNMALILSSYSLPMAVSKLVAVKRSNREYRNAYRVFKCAMVFSVSIGLMATVIILFGADFFSSFYSDNSIALPLRVLAPTIFVFSIMGVLRGFFQGKNTMIPTAISQLLEQIINAAVSIIAALILVKNYSANMNVASYGAAGGTLGTLSGALIGLLFLVFVFAVYRPYWKKQMRRDTDENRESYRTIFKLLLITSVPIILSQTVYQISGMLDSIIYNQIMFHKHLSAFDFQALVSSSGGGISRNDMYTKVIRRALIGIYSGKYKLLTNVPVAIATAIAAAIITTIAASFSKGREDEIRNKVHIAIKFNMIIAIPSAIGMGVLASPILKLIFHDSSVLPANLLRIGSLAVVFFALSTLSSAVLQGINRLRVPVTNSVISLGIHIIFVFILLKFTPLSTYALVIGNVSFALVVCILNWISLERHLNYSQEILKTFLIPTICSLLMGVAAYFSYQGFVTLLHSNLIATLLAILVAVLVYGILLVFLRGVEEEELEMIPKGRSIVRILKKLHLL